MYKNGILKEKVLDILYESFYDNGSVNFAVKQDRKKDKRIKTLLEYSYYKGERFGEIFLSEDEKVAAIIIDPKRDKFTFWDVRLIFKVIGLRGLPKILKREKNLKSFNPKEPFVYLWYVGVKNEDQGQGLGTRLIQDILKKLAGTAVHLQTSNPRNFPLYEKMGFRFDGDYEQTGYAVKVYTYENKALNKVI
jgi:ribosomal protein S18 acetylase RimI-like enzyme